MGGPTHLYTTLLQLPGVPVVDLTLREQFAYVWVNAGVMQWPLAICTVAGSVVIVWKFIELMSKGSATKKLLREVNALLGEHRIDEAMKVCQASSSPGAKILYAGLERRREGTERVTKAIENQGLLELSRLERGLVILATLTTIAPLLGFLGTVIGMIIAFQTIEAAGEVEAILVARGIRVALVTTAMGLVIAIPVSIMNNFFVSRIDSLVVDMEESAQKMIDTLHAVEEGTEA